jgi:hypothetical protein
MKQLDKVFQWLSIFSPLAPLLIQLVKRTKLNRFQTVILILITVSFASDLISKFILRRGNYYLLHGYGLMEALLLVYFYSLAIAKHRNVIYIVGAVFALFYIVNSLTWEYHKFNTYGRSIECLMMIGFSFSLFYQFYSEEEDIFIDQFPLFWINIAILTYFSGAFFSFILSKQILSSKELPWMLHNLSNFLKNILFAVAIWKIQQKSKAI